MKKIFPNISYILALVCVFAFGQIGMSQSTVTVTYVAGTAGFPDYASENGWQLVDVTADAIVICSATGAAASTQSMTITDGNMFELRGFENFGDGWNGTTSNYQLDLTLDTGGSLTYFSGQSGADDNGDSVCGGAPSAGGFVDWAGVIQQPACEIIAPADVTVSTAPGTCDGGFVQLDLATINADCVGIGSCFVDITSGVVQLDHGPNQTGNLMDTPFSITGAPTMTVASVIVTGNWNDDNSFQTEIPELSLEGVLLTTLPFGGPDCQANDIEFEISAADYNAAAGDGVLDFLVGADNDVNGFCATETIELNLAVPTCTIDAINDYNGMEDASDSYPLGTTVVVFSTQDAAGITLTDTTLVTIEDLEGPVFANCPNDFTVTLDPGDCNYTLNFDTVATDNCPALEQDFSVATSNTQGINCNTGGTTQITQHFMAENAAAAGFFSNVSVAVNTAPAGAAFTVNVYTISGGAFPGGTLTLVGSGDGTTTGGTNYFEDVEIVSTDVVAAGQAFVVEVDVPAGINGFFLGYGANPDTWLQAPACGANVPTLAASLGVQPGLAWGYSIQGADVMVENTGGGEGNGDALPIGINIIEYTATDASGNTTVCSFTVVVEEYPVELQTTTLACNGGINFSVDATCTAVITADMILEGGPYGCYEDFVVSVGGLDPAAISGNGTNAVTINAGMMAAFLENGMVGPFEIEVFDPENGNNSCWNGDFMLEDKLAPIFDACMDLTLACTDLNEPGDMTNPGTKMYASSPGIDILSNQSFDYEIEAFGGPVTGVEVDIDISHTWIGDLDIQLTSPAGTTVNLFDNLCGNTDNLSATFSDDGDAFNCGNSTSGDLAMPTSPLAVFAGEESTGTWILTVADNVGGDNGTLDFVSLNISAEGFEVPGAELTDNCGNAVVEFDDVTTPGTCTDEFAAVITRTFTAVDAKGNEAEPCVATISITRETLATVELPTNYDGLPDNNPVISCDAVVLDPQSPTHANGDPNLDSGTYGSVGGVGSCGTIIDYYTDVVIPICDQTCDYSNNSYKVIRKFTILDWCTGEIIEPVQILKVMDNTAPVLADLPDLTVSTDIWGCGATIDLPAALATDNCTADESITYTFSSTAGVQVGNSFVIADPAKTMPGAPIVITVTASDCCGNSSTTEFNVSVVDLIPPVVVAETSRTVSLSTDGLAKAFAEDFDDGSHDGCGPIGFTVKRMDNGAPCPSLDKFPPAGNDNAQFNESVHFCCADTGAPVMVQFRVCDDADMNGVTGTFGDNCNTAMVEVIVQDKLAPQILCPDPMTISCIDLAGLDLTDQALLDELFGTAVGAGTCNVEITQTATGVENCGAGVIFRNFTASNAAGTTSCQQIITVTAGPANTLTCDRISFATLNNNTYDWCDVNDNSNDPDDDLPALQIDCTEGLSVPEVVIDINGLCTEAGIAIEVDSFNFAGGACRKYLVHYEVIDQCIFDENYVDPATGEIDPYNSGNGYFEFFLEIDAFDNVEPTPMCDDITVVAESCTGYNGAITITAEDNCTSPEYFGYQWRLDVDANNTIDFPASGWVATSSVTPQQAGLGEFPIGTHRVFWIISDGCGNDATCSQLITITGNDKEPTPYCYDGLAVAVMPSTGSVQLWAEDFNAGSFDNCGGELVLSMIPEQDVDVDGSDDDAYDLSFNHPNVVQLPNGDWGFDFDCSYIENGISAVLEVRIYVTDADGNYDYCTASLRIDDNFDACPNGSGTVTYDATGELKTEQGDYVVNTNVTVDASFAEFPMTENVEGTYAFELYENVDYTITPERNDDHLNGITTLDIVQIQKHILGIETLESPFQLIAADVNNDCNVTGADLVQLRKLILGKYPTDEFPNNSSWRFVESDYVFTNPQAPCGFSEVADIFNMSEAEVNDFTAAKVGDVNATATANLTMDAETRSNENVEFVVVDNALTVGNTYTVDFLAKDFADVYGFQNTINLTGVEFVGVTAGALNVTENNLGLANIANGTMVVSVDLADGVTVADDAVLFSITVKAVVNANVSDVVAMNSNKLDAQVYVGRDLEVLGNTVVFRTDNGEFASASFELFQNEPNPFNGKTVIGFELPTASQATLTVYDVTGKVLYTKVDGYAKGYNTVTISRNDVSAVGVLYYKLESGDNVATKKMIVLE